MTERAPSTARPGSVERSGLRYVNAMSAANPAAARSTMARRARCSTAAGATPRCSMPASRASVTSSSHVGNGSERRIQPAYDPDPARVAHFQRDARPARRAGDRPGARVVAAGARGGDARRAGHRRAARPHHRRPRRDALHDAVRRSCRPPPQGPSRSPRAARPRARQRHAVVPRTARQEPAAHRRRRRARAPVVGDAVGTPAPPCAGRPDGGRRGAETAARLHPGEARRGVRRQHQPPRRGGARR